MESGLIGRDAEVVEISAFLSATSGTPAALVIAGEGGIGKTAVWKHAVHEASGSSKVLSCQPTSAERLLAFSALDDLLGDVMREVLPALPRHRRRVVEAVLLDSSSESASDGVFEVGHPILEQRLLARGVLNILQVLSSSWPLMVAVDDAQWLDRPSAGVLEFCFRRLRGEPVSILLTFRNDDAAVPLGLDRALPSDRLGCMRLGPLSLGAIGEILRSRLGTVLPRHTLTRLYEACGGNPLYALECARALLERPRMSLTSEPIPIPHSLRGLVRHRVRRLTPAVLRVGRLVAASSDPQERLIRVAYDKGESWAAIDQAVHGGILERDGEVLRFTHPLLRSALYADMSFGQRREVHHRLGAVAEDIEERAWHLGLEADRPDEQIAGTLHAAAEHAASRGAPEAAAALEEQAIRLTSGDRPDAARDRAMYAASYHFRAGDITRGRELIQSALTDCPAGPLRASLLLRLATIHYHQNGWPLAEQLFRQAAGEAPEDPALCAHAEQELAFARLVAGDMPAARHWAEVSLRTAEQTVNPYLIANSLARIALLEFLQGNGIRQELFDRAEALEASAGEEPIERSTMFDPILIKGIVLKWCDRLDEARPGLADRYQHALRRGDEASLPFVLYHFSELECWAGNWDAAEEYALKACRVAGESGQQTMRPATLYSLALIRAHRGQVVQAQDLASEALALCEQTGNILLTFKIASVLGFAALSLDDAQSAHAHLGGLAEATVTAGLCEPGVVKFLPDEIEALAALGQANLARSFTQQLETQGSSLGRPWALATAARCRALLDAVDGNLQGARVACEQALSEHERLPMPFELGRTLLIKGMIDRRAKHKSEARESLSQALGIFEHLGASLWAARARRELSKIAARPSADGLTETERRISALVAQGRTNREVASAIFVTENTVQTHIRHIFKKLGLRSRTELAAWLLSNGASTATVTRSFVASEPR